LGVALQADGEYEVRVYGLKHQKERRSMDHFAVLKSPVCELDWKPGRCRNGCSALAELPVVCVETRHMQATLKPSTHRHPSVRQRLGTE